MFKKVITTLKKISPESYLPGHALRTTDQRKKQPLREFMFEIHPKSVQYHPILS
jgi:hypothetical protein